MKALGAEIKDFYDNHFPEGYYHDDGIEMHDGDGRWLLKDEEKYDLGELGVIVPNDGNYPADAASFESFFRKWKKSRTTVTMVIEVKKEKAEELKKLLEGANVKVLK